MRVSAPSPELSSDQPCCCAHKRARSCCILTHEAFPTKRLPSLSPSSSSSLSSPSSSPPSSRWPTHLLPRSLHLRRCLPALCAPCGGAPASPLAAPSLPLLSPLAPTAPSFFCAAHLSRRRCFCAGLTAFHDGGASCLLVRTSAELARSAASQPSVNEHAHVHGGLVRLYT